MNDEPRQSLSPEEWGERYRPVQPGFEYFAEKLADLLTELIVREGIDVNPIEQRGKEVDSFVQKLVDKGQQYEDPLHEMTDLAGVRVITFYVEDVKRVGEIIQSEFDVDYERSSIGGVEDPDRFGYVSDHYIVRLDSNRAGLAEWQDFAGVGAEIQVRTVLQHAWAAISHKLQYKSAEAVPKELQRQLSRVSALLELADKEFANLAEANEEVVDRYARQISQGNLMLEVNVASLRTYLDLSRRHVEYAHLAVDVNWDPLKAPPEVAAEVGEGELYHLMIPVALGELTSIAQLDDLLPSPPPEEIGGALGAIAMESRERGFPPSARPADVFTIALFYALRDELDAESALDHTLFVPELKEAIIYVMEHWPSG